MFKLSRLFNISLGNVIYSKKQDTDATPAVSSIIIPANEFNLAEKERLKELSIKIKEDIERLFQSNNINLEIILVFSKN